MLPDKPSELIRLALNDLAKCEANPKYKIDMRVWHHSRNGTCSVCLAGSVMAQTLNTSDFVTLVPSDFREERNKLAGLNEFRCGFIILGLVCLGFHKPEWKHKPDREITPYDEDPVAFVVDMHQLADDLEAEGY